MRILIVLLSIALAGGQTLLNLVPPAGISGGGGGGGGGSSTIAFDAASTSTGQGFGTTSYSWNHTIGSSSNTVLIVWTANFAGNNVTAVTFNSVAMTQIPSCLANGGGNSETITAWALVAPTTGTHAVAVTQTGDFAMGGSQSFSGVSQTAPIGNCTFSFAGIASASITISPVSDNTWVADGTYSGSNVTITASTWTNKGIVNDTINGQSFGIATTGPIHPASAQTNNWTSGGAAWVDLAVSLTPAP